MSPLAIVFGLLLTVLGGGFFGYVYSDSGAVQVTALIPAFFGIPLIVAGVIALNEKYRMHAMHGAAFLGLVGFAMPTYMVIKGMMQGDDFGRAKIEQAAMAGLCLVFVGLCVKSFIAARVARKKREVEAAAPK
jgi:hypothetical protein